MNNKSKNKEKEDKTKEKDKTSIYKLQFDIEFLVDIKSILEERILDSKIELTLKKALGIVKKEFYEFIINVMKRKR